MSVFTAPLALAAALVVAVCPHPVATGQVFYYRVGIMREVANNRGMVLDWSANGFASVPNCAWVDPARPWYVLAQIGRGPLERYQIADCSQTADLPAQRRKHLVLEVDHWSAVRADQRGDPRLLVDGKAPVTLWGFRR